MIKAHEIRLYPTKTQECFFKQSCGVARFSYNWALNRWNSLYKEEKNTSAYSLIKDLTKIKRTDYKWMLDVGKTCPQYAIHNLESAFKKFFKKQNSYPKFKKKGIKDSFVAVEKKQDFKQTNFKLWIPRLGFVKCAENLRFDGKVNNVTVKRIADMWFAVININIENKSIDTPIVSENQATVGVDMGIKSMMVLSDGTVYKNPRALKNGLKQLKRLQQDFSRKIKGSNNRKKAQVKVARKHYRILCIRKDAIHKATSEIVAKYGKIIIEDLNVQGMVKNHCLAQAINDVSFGEIRRQLAYKCLWAGKELVKADRFYASSKICSNCGHKKELLKLNERIYKCENCGFEIDRDLNASINLKHKGTVRFTETSRKAKACGVGSSVLEIIHSPAMKQEIVSFDNKLNV